VDNERPIAEAPGDGEDVTSPMTFVWNGAAGASRFELYVIRGNNPPALAGSSTTRRLDGVALAPGRVRWFVRAFFGPGCPPLDSIDQELDVVPPPPACAPLAAPVVTAPGQISSGVPFRLRWNSVVGATSYQLLVSNNAEFHSAETITTTATEHELVRTNTLNASIPVFAKVRALDTTCPTPSVSLYGPAAATFSGLRQALEGTVAVWVEHGPVLRAIAEAAAQDHDVEQAYRGGLLDRFIVAIAERIQTGQALGRIGDLDPRETAAALILMNERYLADRLGGSRQVDAQRAVDALYSIWFGTLYGGRRRAEPNHGHDIK
jgi:hypothetical protein